MKRHQATSPTSSTASSPEAEEICYICLAGEEAGPLIAPCACPRHVHKSCISRWQLTSAGRAEERQCRFCQQTLPDWKETYAAVEKSTPIFTVVCGGTTHQLEVQPGPEGQQQFEAAVRRIFNLADDDIVQLTFGCKVPGTTGGEVTLEGTSNYDAAVLLASISAAERKRKRQQEQQQQRGAGAGETTRCHSQQVAGEQQHGSSRSVMQAVRGFFR